VSETAAVTNARVVTPDEVLAGGVRVEGDRIAAVGDPGGGADRVIDARGRYLFPGLVDLHGDDVESHLYPRAGARMDTRLALTAADRANLAAGITTKFHAMSFEDDEEKDRSPELGRELAETLADLELVADHRLHARCEVSQQESVDAVLDVIDGGYADLVSVMSHIPGKGQFRDVEAFLEYYRESTDHSVEEAHERIERRGELSMETLRERVDRVIAAAQAAGAVTASHDDEEPAEVERLAAAGVDISEYPITLETARRATAVGMTTAMGAPNLVRGESQWGNLETGEAIEAGVVDALVADYHPMSMLAAVFVETGERLPRRLRRVTAAPASAVGLDDRGRIEPGARADLVVVDPEPTPTVTRALVAGEPRYRAEGGR
jgi:alpha-D-ribose 1-methylphosphonate 5-triphosphate diphosphatase